MFTVRRLLVALTLAAALAAAAASMTYRHYHPPADPAAAAFVGMSADDADYQVGTVPCVLPMEWGEYRYYESRDGRLAYRFRVERGVVTEARDYDAAELRRRAKKGGRPD